MTERDEPHPEARPAPATDGQAPEASRPAAPTPALDHAVNYGRLVNVLAAASERLSQRGYTVTEAQTRVILKRMRAGAPGGTDPEQAEYRLGRLARTTGNVAGVDDAFVGSIIRDVVEPRDG